MDVGCTLHLG